MISDRYEAPFAWGLLDATVDFTALPPRFRPPRDVRPFVSLQNEAVSNADLRILLVVTYYSFFGIVTIEYYDKIFQG